MNIKETIRAKMPPAFIEGKLIYVGQEKESNKGKYRFIRLEEDDEVLRVRLNGTYVDSLNGHEGKIIRILGGRAKGGKMVGISFLESEKIGKYVNIKEPAVVIPDIAEYEKSNNEVKKEAQLIKEEEPVKEEKKAPRFDNSPLVKEIERITRERMFIFDVCRQTIDDDGCEFFPREKIAELATSIHIELSRRGINFNSIPQRKERFAEPEKKPDNVIDIEKRGEVVEEVPISKKIIDYLKANEDEPWYHIRSSDGKKVGEVLSDHKSRCAIARWYYSSTLDRLEGRNKEVHNSVGKLIRESGCDLVEDALYYDYAVKTNEEFNYDSAEEIANRIARLFLSKSESKTPKTRYQIAQGYFLLKQDERQKICQEVKNQLEKES